MRQAAPDLPEDPALLKAMVARLQAENTKLTTTLRAYDLVVQALRLQIAKLRKQAFGKSSEKFEREIEQLELALEDVLVTVAQQGLTTSVRTIPRRKPRPLLPIPAPHRDHRAGRVSWRIHRASATSSILAARARIAAAICVSSART